MRMIKRLLATISVTFSVCIILYHMNSISDNHGFQNVLFNIKNNKYFKRITSQQSHISSHPIQRPSCTINSKPHQSIFYVKIPKTGSTTLRNTLLAYGMAYNLTICMDTTDKNRLLNWPDHIDEHKLTKTTSEKCDVIADEIIYNKKTVKKLMKANPFIVTSVRHPVQHFLSIYKSTGIQKAVERLFQKPIDKWDGMRYFFKNQGLVRKVYDAFIKVESPQSRGLIQANLQLHSLGLNADQTIKEIKRKAAEIDFFVVTEKYAESMILLRDHLCCSIEDVMYRKHGIITQDEDDIPDDVKESILKYNEGDLILYGIAIHRLYRQIQQHEGFEPITNIYRYELDKYEKKCANENRPIDHIENVCQPLENNNEKDKFLAKVFKKQQERLLRKFQKSS